MAPSTTFSQTAPPRLLCRQRHKANPEGGTAANWWRELHRIVPLASRRWREPASPPPGCPLPANLQPRAWSGESGKLPCPRPKPQATYERTAPEQAQADPDGNQQMDGSGCPGSQPAKAGIGRGAIAPLGRRAASRIAGPRRCAERPGWIRSHKCNIGGPEPRCLPGHPCSAGASDGKRWYRGRSLPGPGLEGLAGSCGGRRTGHGLPGAQMATGRR